MSAEVAEAIRQTRRTLAEKTWVPWEPHSRGEVCCVTAVPGIAAAEWARARKVWDALIRAADTPDLSSWNDRQTDVGAVLGMTLQAFIAELCKPTSPLHREGVTSSPEKKGPRGL